MLTCNECTHYNHGSYYCTIHQKNSYPADHCNLCTKDVILPTAKGYIHLSDPKTKTWLDADQKPVPLDMISLIARQTWNIYSLSEVNSGSFPPHLTYVGHVILPPTFHVDLDIEKAMSNQDSCKPAIPGHSYLAIRRDGFMLLLHNVLMITENRA